MSFNPNSPCTVGLETPFGLQFDVVLNSPTADNATMDALVVSTTAEAITSVWVPIVLPSGVSGSGQFTLEIFDASDYLTGTPSLDTYTPDMLVDTDGEAWDGANWVAPAAADIANASPTPGDVDGQYIWGTDLIRTRNGHGLTYQVLGIAGAYGSSDQIQSLQVTYVADVVPWSGSGSTQLIPALSINGVNYQGTPQTLLGRQLQPGAAITATWAQNPATLAPWTSADLDEFETGGNSAAGWLTPLSATTPYTVVYYSDLRVNYVGDKRVATATKSGLTAGWNQIPITWTKAAGTTYLVSLRRTSGAGEPRYRVLTATDPSSSPVQGAEVERGADGMPTSIAANQTVPPLIMSLAASLSVDSQPYAGNDGRGLLSGAESDWSRVDVSHTVSQYITLGADDYGVWSVYARRGSRSTKSDLTIKLIDATNTVLATDTLSATGVDASWYQWQRGIFPGAPLALGAGQYRLEFSSSASASGYIRSGQSTPGYRGWLVAVASAAPPSLTGSPPAGTDGVTWGGSADCARTNSTNRTYADVVCTIGKMPPPPTSPAATATGDCAPTVTVSWTASAADGCPAVTSYEIQRMDPQTSWETVGTATGTSWTDREMRRNTTSSYRVRGVRDDGAVSQWASTVTAAPSDSCCGYTFASNALGTSLWYADLGDRSYEFLGNKKDYQLAYQDNHVSVSELQARGDAISVTLAIDFITRGQMTCSTPDGRRDFDDLLEMVGQQRKNGSLQTAPYIAVLDEQGNRWYASVRVTQGDARGGKRLMVAKASWVEVSGPSVA